MSVAPEVGAEEWLARSGAYIFGGAPWVAGVASSRARDARDAAGGGGAEGDTPHSSAIMLQAAAPARAPQLAPPASFAAAGNAGVVARTYRRPPRAPRPPRPSRPPRDSQLDPAPVAAERTRFPADAPPPTMPLSARSAASSAARIAHVTAMTGASAAAIAGAYASPLLSASSSALRPPPPLRTRAQVLVRGVLRKGVSSRQAREQRRGRRHRPVREGLGQEPYRSVSTTLGPRAPRANPRRTRTRTEPSGTRRRLPGTKSQRRRERARRRRPPSPSRPSG